MENSKTLDSKYFYWLLENAIFWGDLTEAENQLENDLQNNYECKNTDYNYRKNSFLQSFEDLFRVAQQCSYFIKGRPMEDLLIQSWLYLEELLNNNWEIK
jgi:hypothetical protein